MDCDEDDEGEGEEDRYSRRWCMSACCSGLTVTSRVFSARKTSLFSLFVLVVAEGEDEGTFGVMASRNQ